jgi:putative ATP-dependent endonuclease of the OLD family
MRVANKVPQAPLSSPILFFSSDRAFTKSFDVGAGDLTDDNYHNGFRTAFSAATGQTNLLQWGAQHFVRTFRRAQAKASAVRDKVTDDFLRNDPDVQLLDRYLGKLGYDWTFAFDQDQTRFRFALTRGELVIYNDYFSSGEREIVHFLLAMFTLNVRAGLVLVDEPELHLHPRWQMIFLGLFRDLSLERANQFVICTHSPVFVTPDTINSVIRVYKGGTEGSRKVALSEVSLPNKAQLVRMINSQNNERLFFADRVVLVEGPSDRLVFASLLEAAAARLGDNSAVEVIDVGGKHNFGSYQSLLDALQTPWTVIADRDYLAEIGPPAVKALFTLDNKRAADAILEDKKSLDRATLLDAIRSAIGARDFDSLASILGHIEARHRTLKTGLTAEESAAVVASCLHLSERSVHILDGEIEDYLPTSVRGMPSIVEFVSDRNWIVNVPAEDKRRHLAEIACHVLGIVDSSRKDLVEAAASGAKLFPDPVVGDGVGDARRVT